MAARGNRYLYIDAAGRTRGPFWLTQMRALWQGGRINMTTLVCREGTDEWAAVEFSPEIFEAEARMPALKRITCMPSDPNRLLIWMTVLLAVSLIWMVQRMLR